MTKLVMIVFDSWLRHKESEDIKERLFIHDNTFVFRGFSEDIRAPIPSMINWQTSISFDIFSGSSEHDDPT